MLPIGIADKKRVELNIIFVANFYCTVVFCGCSSFMHMFQILIVDIFKTYNYSYQSVGFQSCNCGFMFRKKMRSAVNNKFLSDFAFFQFLAKTFQPFAVGQEIIIDYKNILCFNGFQFSNYISNRASMINASVHFPAETKCAFSGTTQCCFYRSTLPEVHIKVFFGIFLE
ncbi:MAG: hypothetical protein BWZ11_01798 [Bacteroidetes bacterium ADurb.BinA395]|nr:MAG: hypothetical protein BWZ11_01798 [Bacteroidetes bacterium ADurb.BinA395]